MLRFRPVLASFAVLSAAQAASVPLSGTIASFEIGDADPYGNREDGVVRILGSDLKSLNLGTGISFANIAIWSGAGDTLPRIAGATVAAPALRPIPILRKDKGRDGIFDPEDEIWFWAEGANHWKADSSWLGWSYTIQPWETRRRYLIRFDAPSGSPDLAEAVVPSDPKSVDVLEQLVQAGKPSRRLEDAPGDKLSSQDMGVFWYWLSSSDSTRMRIDLPAMPGRKGDSVEIQLFRSPSTVLASPFPGALLSVGIDGASTWKALGVSANVSAWRGSIAGGNRIGLEFGKDTKLALQQFVLSYPRDPASADSAVLAAPGAGAISFLARTDRVCWVLEGGVAVRACGVKDGRFVDSAAVPDTRYVLFPASTVGIRPTLSSWSEPSGAHVVKDWGATRKADVLVIAPRSLLSVAERYAELRESAFQVRPMKVAVVALEDLYDLWSRGTADPVAIRDATRWAVASWGINHLLLLGGGHGDPRGIDGAGTANLVQRWQVDGRDTDDFFGGILGGNFQYSDSGIPVGRIPARSLSEAEAWFAKLLVFEDPSRAAFGAWRNRVVLAADDMVQAGDYDNMDHVEDMEQVAETIGALRPWMQQDKVYLVQYPINKLGQKPEAARDLQGVINSGAAAMNYIGHGGSDILADENLMSASDVERSLKNEKTPFLFFAGSCTVGRNDQINRRGLAEVLVNASGKGAMASVAATRSSFDDVNTRFALALWSTLLDSNGARTLGEAVWAAKRSNQSDYLRNHYLYNILGDPAMVLFPGGLKPSLESGSDTLPALSKRRISGKAASARAVQARLEVLPEKDSASYVDCDREVCTTFKQHYLKAPKQILAASTAMASDSFALVAGLPARVPFGSRAIVATYVWDSATRRDGGVVSGEKLFYGTAATGTDDHEGPSISVRPCDSSWSGGVEYGKEARIPVPFCLAVRVQDSSGIAYDQGPDEGLVFGLPGLVEPWHPELRQEADYRSASALFVIDSSILQPGASATFEVGARDLMGNLSRRRVLLSAQEVGEVGLFEVFNSPNPVRSGTSTAFHFKIVAEPDTNGSVDTKSSAAIRIHTLSGKLVRVLRTQVGNVPGNLPRAVWDLRDSFGTPVANGLYPYTVILRTPNASGTGTIQREARGVVAISR